MSRQYIAITLLIGCITVYAYYRITSISNSIASFISTLTPIIDNPLASYDTKMTYMYPGYYQYIQSLNKILPTSSVVYQTNLAIPHGSTNWPSSHIKMNSAWLAPRSVMMWPLDGKVKEQSGLPTYVMIVNEFPGLKIDSKKVVIIDTQGNILSQFVGSYDPLHYSAVKYGYIEL